MVFESIKSPNDLMSFLDQNFQYGVIDNNGNKFFDSDSEHFQHICATQWRLRSVDQMLKDGVGHCYDQVEIERAWFENNGYEIKTFWVVAYQKGIENSGFSHTYLIYKDKDKWKLFEHADFFNKGIFEFDSINDAVKWQAKHQIEYANRCKKPIKKYCVCIKEYKKPPLNINMDEYIEYIDNFEDYKL